MNKLTFFNALKKAVKHLPLEDQKLILKDFDFRYQQERIKGIKDKEIIASFGTPEQIVEQYLSSKTENNVEVNENLTADYQREAPRFEMQNNSSKEKNNTNERVVEFNPSLGLEVEAKEEKTETTGEVEAKEEKTKKEYKKIPFILIPIWLILIVLQFAISLVISFLYIPFFFLCIGIILSSIAVIAGAVIQFIGGNIFVGLFQLGIGILVATLGVTLIAVNNLIVRRTWKNLVIMFKKMGGKKK